MARAGELWLSLFLKAPLIVISTVLFGTASLLGSLFDPTGGYQHGCARRWSRIVLAVAGVRLEVGGHREAPPAGPSILCANHQSDMDIPVLLAALPFQFRFAAKKSLFRVPFLGWHLRRAGHVPIDRENPRAALRALDGSASWVRRGLPVVMFPEGRISPDGEVSEFKRGAFHLAERTGASLIPITIRGTRDILEPDSWILRSGLVGVTIGPPLSSNTMSSAEMRTVIRERIVTQVSDSTPVRHPAESGRCG
jgi:1-acyl-sn-glycerol-3-phosphate acyltransferase